ncbi:hypothetical protein BV22DRAFT_408192 [Leucogyrophana mollusca]|uniref:Uncharacterized protein n=1 Tax=Leucogyrophana mollusca TaxID=85980 RepID=A0ACB8BKA5_9AGAM|nr:hypothetical protein BV22DRAFT_408192 [Leucogyrophana mollusca]
MDEDEFEDADEGDDDEGDDGDYEAMSVDDELSLNLHNSGSDDLKVLFPRLRKDFIEIQAAGYRPGIIWIGHNDFLLTVSIPVIALSKRIPPHALLAWDRHLLSPNQRLTLVISGLRGVYPPLQPDGTLSYEALHTGTALRFKVGLTRAYKPAREHVMLALRTFGLVNDDTKAEEGYSRPGEPSGPQDDRCFEKFSLSSSLESLLDAQFAHVVELRRKFNLGWAGAETLQAESETSQKAPTDIMSRMKEALCRADKDEATLAASYKLPGDPLAADGNGEINLLLTSFAYLLRRLTLCTRYCVVCHRKLNTQYEALKPYVCESNLCAFQYYSLNLGPSLEYDICTNTETVDLLVALAYTAAADGVLDEPLPRGLALRVPLAVESADADGLYDFDKLDLLRMRQAIAQLIDSLPPIEDMKRYLEKKVAPGTMKPRLKDMSTDILPAAWTILRWCVASCTAHIQELTSEDELLRNIRPEWRQFRFMVGAPDKEAKFKTAVDAATRQDANANKYPTIFGFHGSNLKNWHSIIRHGLWFKEVINGRAYGHGVYFAKQGETSMGHYSSTSTHQWRNSNLLPVTCTALAEIVNLPAQYVSSQPHYVVQDTSWIMCRYLLVKSSTENYREEEPSMSKVPAMALDPNRIPTLDGKSVHIPQPSYKLEKMLSDCRMQYVDDKDDEDDRKIIQEPSSKPLDEWVHDPEWVSNHIIDILPPPEEATPAATMALTRELKAMMAEQRKTSSRDLGWYMPPEHNGENLFQWIVEMHSFDPELPIAKDMVTRGLNSLIFEIRFPPTFPHSPPFFRIILPRFLPFVQGGGGHVTVGGSICMDLLTSDGWLPSYSISAVLLQIKLAISSTDPRPARLAGDWDRPYSPQDALDGYQRAAAIHNWKIPNKRELERLVR